ncbi:hypothetical protein ACSAZK_17650 [Methanosarcina sp. Mfa9]
MTQRSNIYMGDQQAGLKRLQASRQASRGYSFAGRTLRDIALQAGP